MSKYGVIGNPVAHSWSPFIHQQFSLQTKITLTYQALKIDCPNEEAFEKALVSLFEEGYKGLNITLPYKIWAFNVVGRRNGLSERAKSAQAVNCISFIDENQWVGDNTDGIGLIRDLKQNLRWGLVGKAILLLGAGGAATGVLSALLQEKPARLDIWNRGLVKAKALAEAFSTAFFTISALEQVGSTNYDLIINATSASLTQNLPRVIHNLNAENSYCYDMVYGSTVTTFLTWSISQGAKAVSDGLGMLVEQAAESFYQWHQVMPETKEIIKQLRNRL